MPPILDYSIRNNNGIFENDVFRDTAELKHYIAQVAKGGQPPCPAFDFMYALVENMTQLRFHAEEKQRKHPFEAKDKRKELPLSWREVTDIMTAVHENEPPQTVISKIAQQEIHIIDNTLQNPRKILKRERRTVHISDIQQLDPQCLIWLTRQPGITPVQKAGSRQKILSVVREESFNTLENRVLKTLLKSCLTHGSLYIQQYGGNQNYVNSERIRAVRKLVNTCKAALQSPMMQKVASLTGMPIPNYVLLHDPYYTRIWQMYQELLRQTKLLETAWKKRHKIFKEYFFLIVSVCLEMNYTSVFESKVWLNYTLQNEEFIHSPFFSRIFSHNGHVVEFGVHGELFRLPVGRQPRPELVDAYLRSERGIVSFSLVFIPSGVEALDIQRYQNHCYIVHNESPQAQLPQGDMRVLNINRLEDMAGHVEPLLQQIIERIAR